MCTVCVLLNAVYFDKLCVYANQLSAQHSPGGAWQGAWLFLQEPRADELAGLCF